MGGGRRLGCSNILWVLVLAIPSLVNCGIISDLPEHEVDKVLDLYHRSCGDAGYSSGGSGYGWNSNPSNINIVCKEAREYPSTVHEKKVIKVPPNPNTYKKQVIFVEVPATHFKHEITLVQEPEPEKKTKIYVLPQKATHSVSVHDQRVQTQAPKPQVFYLKGDNNHPNNKPEYGAPPNKPPSASYGQPDSKPPPPQSSYGESPANPPSQYGQPPSNPAAQYGQPPSNPASQYGSPPSNPASQYGSPSNSYDTPLPQSSYTLPPGYLKSTEHSYDHSNLITSSSYNFPARTTPQPPPSKTYTSLSNVFSPNPSPSTYKSSLFPPPSQQSSYNSYSKPFSTQLRSLSSPLPQPADNSLTALLKRLSDRLRSSANSRRHARYQLQPLNSYYQKQHQPKVLFPSESRTVPVVRLPSSSSSTKVLPQHKYSAKFSFPDDSGLVKAIQVHNSNITVSSSNSSVAPVPTQTYQLYSNKDDEQEEKTTFDLLPATYLGYTYLYDKDGSVELSGA